jgi:hypothetical protein
VSLFATAQRQRRSVCTLVAYALHLAGASRYRFGHVVANALAPSG